MAHTKDTKDTKDTKIGVSRFKFSGPGDRRIAEKILRLLGVWSAPDRPPPAPRRAGWLYEPCDDLDPLPDYKKVLTD